MKARTAICCVALIALAMTSANVAAQSFGFEEPDQGDSGWAYATDLTGWAWTAVGGAGLSGPDGPWQCDSTSPDPLGDQFAFLQGVSSISQTVTGLTVGAWYEVTFYEATRTGYAGNDLTVIIDDGLSSEVTINTSGIVDNATWELRTATAFVAENTSCSLTFRTTNPQDGDRATIVDGASIDEVPPPPPPPPVITPSSAWAIAGQSFSLTATAGGTGYQWSKVGVGNIGTPSDSPVLAFDPLEEAHSGTYSVTYDDGTENGEATASYVLFVYPADTVLPLTGLIGLGLLAGACALGGASALRRKK